MKCVFIINPRAGAEDNEQKIRSAAQQLGGEFDCEFYVTQAVGDATDYVRRRCEENTDGQLRFIACGGDGTINEVFNGAVGQKGVSVTCYPCGSGNDFVKAFGGAERFLDIAALAAAPVRKLDLLEVGGRYSNNVVNFGFDTTVAMTVNSVRDKTGHGGKSAYTKGIVKALISSMRNRCTVVADGETLNPDGELLLCTLANGQYVGGSFRCAPRAECDDGLIEVCLVKPISRLRFVQIIGTYTKGEHLDDERLRDVVVYRQAKRIEIFADDGFTYSLDGEIIHSPHFSVEIAPAMLDFAVPEEK